VLLRLLLYFDVFHHPLTVAELTRFAAPGAPGRVSAALARLVEQGRVAAQGTWRFRPGAAADLARREERARHAERAWPKARAAAALLARLPFVRGVVVTGGLSKNSTSPDGDVDFLLLVQPGRVWSLKTLVQFGRRPLPEPLRELFCTNYLLASDRLEVDDQNLFTAVELATAVPLFGPALCAEWIGANPWARRFVPGLDWCVERALHARPLPARRLAGLAEAALSGPLGGRLEQGALEGWDRFWNRKYAWVPEVARNQRFKRRAELATNHLHDFQGWVLGEVGARLAAQGLDPALVGPVPAGSVGPAEAAR
jgi:hypothetical protein